MPPTIFLLKFDQPNSSDSVSVANTWGPPPHLKKKNQGESSGDCGNHTQYHVVTQLHGY